MDIEEIRKPQNLWGQWNKPMCPMGIEPTSKDFGDLCSIQLSYGHKITEKIITRILK